MLGVEAGESAKVVGLILDPANSKWTMDQLKKKVIDMKKESSSARKVGSDNLVKFMKDYQECSKKESGAGEKASPHK